MLGYLSQEELAAQSIVTNLDLCWAQVAYIIFIH